MKIINPATENIIKEVKEDTQNSVAKTFLKLQKGQPIWAQLDLHERIQRIKQFSANLEAHRNKLAKSLSEETGKPIKEALNEISGARYRIQYFIENSENWLRPRLEKHAANVEESIVFEPLGVVSYISAWNYPYLIFMNVGIPALIAGNSVLYKPSEFSTLTGLSIGKLMKDSGIDESAFALAVGGKEVGQAVVAQPSQAVFFTGSYKTGHALYQTLAPRMIPVGLELGGKDPLYVTNSIDSVADVAAAALEGAFYNNGQSCCAVERIYVHEAVYEEFVSEFKSRLQTLKVGDPMAVDTTQGPLTRPQQVQVLREQVEDARQKGGEVYESSQVLPEKGYYFLPTVIFNASHDMVIMREESFGPVIGVQTVSSDEEAIELMLDTEYGLTSSVYCNDRDRGERILAQMNSGTGYLNCCDRVSPYLPWSGRKNSGLGSTLSFLGILSFVRPKGLHIRQ